MNLVVDIGNTCCKVALYNNRLQVSKKVFSIDEYSVIIDYINSLREEINSSILCSVSDYPKTLVELLKNISRFILFNSETETNISNKYETPKSLGLDRLAAIVGAQKYFPDSNVLVIDIGTAITYDFVNENKEYLGGGISPGLKLRFKSLNNFTSNLPFIELDDVEDKNSVFENFVGNSTKNSLISGVLNGILSELSGIIKMYKSKHNKIKIIGTGGDLKFFENKLKNTIFANDDLVLEGLNEILEYNVK